MHTCTHAHMHTYVYIHVVQGKLSFHDDLRSFLQPTTYVDCMNSLKLSRTNVHMHTCTHAHMHTYVYIHVVQGKLSFHDNLCSFLQLTTYVDCMNSLKLPRTNVHMHTCTHAHTHTLTHSIVNWSSPSCDKPPTGSPKNNERQRPRRLYD